MISVLILNNNELGNISEDYKKVLLKEKWKQSAKWNIQLEAIRLSMLSELWNLTVSLLQALSSIITLVTQVTPVNWFIMTTTPVARNDTTHFFYRTNETAYLAWIDPMDCPLSQVSIRLRHGELLSPLYHQITKDQGIIAFACGLRFSGRSSLVTLKIATD